MKYKVMYFILYFRIWRRELWVWRGRVWREAVCEWRGMFPALRLETLQSSARTGPGLQLRGRVWIPVPLSRWVHWWETPLTAAHRASNRISNRSVSVSQVKTVQWTSTNVSRHRVKTEEPVKISSMHFSAGVRRGSQVCTSALYDPYPFLNAQHRLKK